MSLNDHTEALSQDMPSQSNSHRRYKQTTTSLNNEAPKGARQINAAQLLENPRMGVEPHERVTVPRTIAMAGIMLHSALPAVISWGLTMGLIFGGCCSNVFALEAIVKEEPESGLLITFTQFFMTFLFTLPAHVSTSGSLWSLKAPAVPIMRWLPSVAMFFIVNMMNNFAFGYNISVPVHIILRSGGSVTTMLAGFVWGKRYTKGQIAGVAMLTVGVIIAAMADAQSKGKMSTSPGSASESSASFVSGLLVLFIAQLLSAIMGIYVQNTYAIYGPYWNENLFYSHFLSLPLFVPFYPHLRDQFARLLDSPPIIITPSSLNSLTLRHSLQATSWRKYLSPIFSPKQPDSSLQLRVPMHVLTLALNSLTQYACIRGVNLLGARTSALGVTVVLNLRKLVSLFASIWLFGNKLPPGVLFGAVVVFVGAGIYSMEDGRAQKDKAKLKKG